MQLVNEPLFILTLSQMDSSTLHLNLSQVNVCASGFLVRVFYYLYYDCTFHI